MNTKKLEEMSDDELIEYRNYCVKQKEYYSMMSDINKLSMNSLYGAISNQYSRFYSISLAASVTITGQQIEKFQMWKAAQIVEAVWN